MKSNQEIALEIMAGKWGNGVDRRNRITAAGYDYTAVQTIVNVLVRDGYTPPVEPEPAQAPQPSNPLRVEFNPAEYDAIEITILI